jgi:alpha-glucosidase (family GH31 glycosyl hydrolase)
MNQHRIPHFLLWFILCLQSLFAQSEQGTVVVGNARFEVIAPNLIRIEYASDNKFVDLPSFFALNRNIRDADAHITRAGNKVEIDTSIIQLIYQPDGMPFSAGNLQAHIKNGNKTATWNPGARSQNLGGTREVLDWVTGPVPLSDGILTREGWYLLDDSRSPLFSGDWIQQRPKNGNIDWYLFGYGDDYKAAFRSFTAVSGPVPLPRKYVLGVWYSRYWPYTEDEFKQIVQEYDKHDFPLDMLVMDMDWHLTKKTPQVDPWSGYTWDRALIPDPPGLLKWLHQQGLHLTVNDHPRFGLQPDEEQYADFMRAMGQSPDSGRTIPFDAGDKHYLDTFFQYSHVPREKEGVDFWWLDYRSTPTRTLPDVDGLGILNYYYYTKSESGGLRGQAFGPWGGWGGQRYPINFSADADSGWNMLRFEVPFTSTAGNVGTFYWSNDIGGFRGGRNEEAYTRWCQFGALSATLRSHSDRNAHMDKRPWSYPAWAEDSMHESFHLRSRLMPYFYTSMWQATRTSTPFIRQLYIDNPESEDAYHNGQEYLFGDDLLVAPITSPGVGPDRTAWQAVWFPEDDWYDFFTGEKFTGPSYAVAADGIGTFPLFVRGGVPLPMQVYTARPGTAPLTKLVLRCYPGREGRTGKSVLYEDDGLTPGYEKSESGITPLTYDRNGDSITVTVGATAGTFTGQPASRQCTIELPDTARLTACSFAGAQTTYDDGSATNTITLPENSIRHPISVTIQAAEVAPDKITGRAVQGRLARLLGKPQSSVLTEDGASVPDDLKEAYAAAEGVAVIKMNQHPYFLGNDVTYRYFHNHHSSPDNISIAFSNSKSEDLALRSGQTLPPELAPGAQGGALEPGASFLPNLTHATFSMKDAALTFPTGFMLSLDASRNIAKHATVESSSGDPAPAIDGIVDGYPHDEKKEWVTTGQTDGAWIKLTWPQSVDVSSVALYDRPNPVDHILAGTLEFSDGSKEEVGSLPNDGLSPLILTFPKKSIQWLKFSVTQTASGTKNVGLAEIAVFADKP